eukprot:scaffold1387_cov260-Pinguiococcus_pyrenoidosus.AAC.6
MARSASFSSGERYRTAMSKQRASAMPSALARKTFDLEFMAMRSPRSGSRKYSRGRLLATRLQSPNVQMNRAFAEQRRRNLFEWIVKRKWREKHKIVRFCPRAVVCLSG